MLTHNYFTSSIGKKQIMAITGLGLVGFTLSHLLGNLLLLLGPDAFNMYAHTLTSNPLIYVAEAGLLGMFLAHIALAVILKIQNSNARPIKYYMKKGTEGGETLASKTMPYTGLIILVFLVLHLITFKYGTNYSTTVDGETIRDIHRVVIEYFSNCWYVAWYVFAMCVLGLHTSHGLHSSLQTLGVNHPKYTPYFKQASLAYGIIVAVGFSTLAIFSYFQN